MADETKLADSAFNMAADNIVTAVVDGPNGVATQIRFWSDRESFDKQLPAMITLDFPTIGEMLYFFQLNAIMVGRVKHGIEQAARDRANKN